MMPRLHHLFCRRTLLQRPDDAIDKGVAVVMSFERSSRLMPSISK
jgi:hypothetical protein